MQIPDTIFCFIFTCGDTMESSHAICTIQRIQHKLLSVFRWKIYILKFIHLFFLLIFWCYIFLLERHWMSLWRVCFWMYDHLSTKCHLFLPLRLKTEAGNKLTMTISRLFIECDNGVNRNCKNKNLTHDFHK